MKECQGRWHHAQELRAQALETDQAELCIPEPGHTDPALLECSGTDNRDNFEERQEHWSGLRKPNCSPGPASTWLYGLEEVTKLRMDLIQGHFHH